MSFPQLIDLIGSLFFLVFAPIVSAQIILNFNYFQNGKGNSVIIITGGIVWETARLKSI